MIELDVNQLDAVDKLHNGAILCAEVGTGKSRTALAYYYIRECGGQVVIKTDGKTSGINKEMRRPRDLYIITTAKKRDSKDWHLEAGKFGLFTDRQDICPNQVRLVVDSWNNIQKYRKVYGAFFIFDEQRVTGRGPWVKAFLDIARKNRWILLSATPGDVWLDYIPVFVANGYFKNRTQFFREHVILNPYTPFQQVKGYRNEGLLNRYRADILVKMRDMREARTHKKTVYCNWDRDAYKVVFNKRWDIYENKPIENTAKLYSTIRQVINSDPSRIEEMKKLIRKHDKIVIFYNFNFELDALRKLYSQLCIPYSEWNGQKHEDILEDESRWGYFVQYLSGSEGWNCISTNVLVYFSQNYSYKMMHQAEGRINRRNTPYSDLYYYTLMSMAPIDCAIAHKLKNKQDFNMEDYIRDSQ